MFAVTSFATSTAAIKKGRLVSANPPILILATMWDTSFRLVIMGTMSIELRAFVASISKSMRLFSLIDSYLVAGRRQLYCNPRDLMLYYFLGQEYLETSKFRSMYTPYPCVKNIIKEPASFRCVLSSILTSKIVHFAV